MVKVKGENNVADGLTKHVDRSKLEKYMNECGFTLRDGQHEVCPHLGDGKFFVRFNWLNILSPLLQPCHIREYLWFSLDPPWIQIRINLGFKLDLTLNLDQPRSWSRTWTNLGSKFDSSGSI